MHKALLQLRTHPDPDKPSEEGDFLKSLLTRLEISVVEQRLFTLTGYIMATFISPVVNAEGVGTSDEAVLLHDWGEQLPCCFLADAKTSLEGILPSPINFDRS